MFLTKLSHTEQNYGWELYNICCLGNHPSTEPALSHKWCGEEVCLDREQCELFSSFPTSIHGLSMPYKVNRNLRVCAQSLSPVWLCDPMDCSLPSSSVRGISQSRIPEWVAIPFSRGSSWCISSISCIGRQILYHWTTWEDPVETY